MRIDQQGILYFEYSELVPGFVSDSNFKQLKNRGQLEATRACKGRPAEIVYESLPQRYKDAVLAKYPNPYATALQQEVVNSCLTPDVAALTYFENYVFDNNQRMDTATLVKTKTTANWLSLAVKLKHKSPAITAELRKQLTKEHWALFFEVLELQNPQPKIPTSYTRLMRKLDEYYNKQTGTYNYDILIHGGIGQRNAAKIAMEEQEHVLTDLCMLPQNLYDTQVMHLYNKMAEQKGWPTISETTVRNWRQKSAYLTDASARGVDVYRNTRKAQVKRTRPNNAGLFWGYDGWTVELFLRDANNKPARLELMAVVDHFNNHIVGYHIGKEDTTTIRKSIKAAVDYVHAKTGKYYFITELQHDRFQLTNLSPFYEAATLKHTSPEVGNAKAKPIEPFFKQLNDNVFKLQPNWSGYGITSRKESQPNLALIQKHKAFFPTIQEGYDQIRMLVEKHRQLTEAAWLESFISAAAAGKFTEMSYERYLEVFGETTGHSNTLYGYGMPVTIGGKKITYDLLLPEFREMMWCTWTVHYNANNLNTVLAISAETGKRFLLTQKAEIPMAAAEMTEEHAHTLNQVLGYNRHHEKLLNDRVAKVNQTMDGLDAEWKHLQTRKTMPVIKGQQKIYLQEAKGVTDIEEEIEWPLPPRAKKSKIEDVDWEAKALDDL